MKKKKLFKFFIIAMLTVCGVACEQSEGVDEGNENNNVPTTLVIEVSNVTATGATVSVKPSNRKASYYFDIVKKEVLDNYKGGEKTFLADYAAELKEMIDKVNGYGYEGVLSSGKDSHTYELGSLEQTTDYYAFAFCMTADGKYDEEGLTKVEFTTFISDHAFEIVVTKKTEKGATVSVEPTNSDTYYFDVIEKKIFDSYTDKRKFASEYIEMVKAHYESQGSSFQHALSFETDSYSYEGNLIPNTEYYAVAFGVTTSCDITTDVTTEEFKTSPSNKDLKSFDKCYFKNCGDHYGTNATNWYIDFYSSTTNDYFVIELQGDLSETAPVAGEYPILSTFEAGTAVAGGVKDNHLYGTYWGRLDDSKENLVESALCISGTVKVEKPDNLNGKYTIKIEDGSDKYGNSIKLSYTGELKEWVEENTPSTQKLNTRGNFVLRKATLDNFVPKHISR